MLSVSWNFRTGAGGSCQLFLKQGLTGCFVGLSMA